MKTEANTGIQKKIFSQINKFSFNCRRDEKRRNTYSFVASKVCWRNLFNFFFFSAKMNRSQIVSQLYVSKMFNSFVDCCAYCCGCVWCAKQIYCSKEKTVIVHWTLHSNCSHAHAYKIKWSVIFFYEHFFPTIFIEQKYAFKDKHVAESIMWNIYSNVWKHYDAMWFVITADYQNYWLRKRKYTC